MSAQLFDIQYASPLADVDPENDNIDVHVQFVDGRVYSFLVATPNNIYRCMKNSGEQYYFGTPPLFVTTLDHEHIEEALIALVSEYDGRWLDIYGTLQQTTEGDI